MHELVERELTRMHPVRVDVPCAEGYKGSGAKEHMVTGAEGHMSTRAQGAQGLQGAQAQGHKGARVQGCNVHGYKDARQGYKGCKGIRPQGHRYKVNTRYMGAQVQEVQGFAETGTQDWNQNTNMQGQRSTDRTIEAFCQTKDSTLSLSALMRTTSVYRP